MYADILFDFSDAAELGTGAAAAFRALDVRDFEERESSNYVDGRYFAANVDQVRYEIAIVDDEDAGDLRFWLAMEQESEGVATSEFESIVKEAIVNLKASGARVARVYDMGKKTMRVVHV